MKESRSVEQTQMNNTGAKFASQTVFNHCFIQNLAMIFSHKRLMLKSNNPALYEEILHLLKDKMKSLEYASPFILEQLLNCTQQVDEDGELTGHSDDKVMEKLKN